MTKWAARGKTVRPRRMMKIKAQSYVQGSEDVTVTVESYSTDVDTSGAAAADSWSEYAVEKA